MVTQNYIDVEKTQATGEVTFEELPFSIERPELEEQTSFIYIIGAVLVGTVILFLLIRFNFGILWKLWYFFAVFLTLVVAFGAFIPHLWAGIVGLGVALWKILRPNIFVHNISELFIYGGLAAIFVPIMNVFAALMLLILISLYDMYAVWKSKHMIKLAKFQAESKVFAGFYIPYKLPKRTKKGGVKQKVKTAILGGGDIGFPLIFAGVVLKEVGLFKTLAIPVFATIALFILLLKSKEEKFYPAMPFLTVGCLIGYGIVLLL